MTDREGFLLRIDPELLTAPQRWAADERRSVNGQVEFLLRRALAEAGRPSVAPSAALDDHPEDEWSSF
jgi:hypothetical protein